MSWPLLFHSVEKVPRKYCILRSAASDHHIRLLPVAFYSCCSSLWKGKICCSLIRWDKAQALQSITSLVLAFLYNTEVACAAAFASRQPAHTSGLRGACRCCCSPDA
nr:PREDICTED: uncharacterized protein LOC106487440 isoform X2 [Apteryx mantelli mantelli]